MRIRVNRAELAAAMVRADLNCNQVAKMAGISRGTLTAVRSGKSCSPATAQKLAVVLGQSIIEKGE